MTRMMEIAHKHAPKGDHKIYKMAAIVIKGGAIVSVGWNHGWHHAEQRALKPHGDYRGCKIYVARENGGISKPCPKCMDKIRAAGIKEIHYMDRNKNPVREYVR